MHFTNFKFQLHSINSPYFFYFTKPLLQFPKTLTPISSIFPTLIFNPHIFFSHILGLKMPLTSLVGPHSGTATYLDANASASEPQLIQIAKPSADTHMGKSEKRLKDAEIYVPIVYGTIAFWLGRKATETQSHKWTVYVRGATNEDLSVIIKRAVFQLHPSFNNPVRVVESPPFEVSECGWGEFEIGISLYFHNDVSEKKLDLYHPLKLYSENEPGPLSTKKPVVMENYDEIVFPEPSEDFLSRVKGHPAAVVPRLPATFNLPQRRDAHEMKRGDTKNHPLKQWFINFSEADELLKLAGIRQQVQTDIIKLRRQLSMMEELTQTFKPECENVHDFPCPM